MIGTTLDKYAVLQKVGEGGMATVYRGRHATLDRDVAIKVLHPHLSSSTRNRKRFEREAQAIEHLRHDNILEIYDYSGLEGSDCYIVTEFVEGDTLSALLARRGRLPSEVATLLGVPLCRALSYAHRAGVLHRDIKPDNVMLRHDGTLKLMDFGIARFLDETKVTMTGALVGSPAFMSPEQAREGVLDARSDLFSLGTVLYLLVTGSLPFTGNNPSVILKNVIEGNRPGVTELAPTASPTLADLVERLMATDPNDRPSTAEEVEAELLRALAEVHLSIDAPDWSLLAWLRDPDPWEKRLESHLEATLLAEGRRRLQEGDQLGALRQLNRLLSMREDHPEVLALVQGLHAVWEPAGGEVRADTPVRATRARGRWLGAASGAAVVLGLAGILLVGGMGASTPGRHAGEPGPRPAPEPVPAATALPAPAPEESALAPAPAAPTPPPLADVRPASIVVVRPRPEPVAPPPLPAPAPPVVDAFATVRLNTRQFVADVYLHDKKMGSTRDALLLPAGTHHLLLKNRLYEDEDVEVSVVAGEERVVEVSLRPRPSRVTFPDAWSADCAVTANGRSQGTLAALGRTLAVTAPDQPLEVALACPGGAAASHRFASVPPVPGVRFPEPP